MIQVKNFASAAEADACLAALGGYADPSGVNVLKGPATHEVAVVFVQQMHITNRRIALADIPAWNKAIGQWTEACNQQVIIH